MRVERTLVGILFLVAAASGGCGGQLAYNLPPATRLMEPGPGVGGPGPGVIPPAGNPYGLYGGAVGRFGDGAGTYMGGYGDGVPCGPYATNDAVQPMGAPRAMGAPRRNAIAANATSDVVQASYSCGCGGACGCGGGCGGACGCDDGYSGDCGCGGNCGGECGCGPGCGCGGGSGCCCLNEFCNDCHAFVGACAQCGCAPGQCLCATLGGALHGILDGHHGHMRSASMDAGAFAGMATSQIAFLGAEGVQVSWDVGGYGMFDSVALVIPGRQDFYQGAIYRLKLSNIPGRPGVELYPTLEVAPVTPRTDAYLAHSPIPVQFTEEDFDQALSGNFVTKVIYLPDPEFQELALAGVETLVSTRLDPGVDPIAEADRRGSILAIVRLGNKDLEPGYGDNTTIESGQVVPAPYVTPMSGEKPTSYESQAIYSEPAKADTRTTNTRKIDTSVVQAQYGEPCGPGYGGVNMPMGMPTSGFAPPAMPPNYVAGAPQWGMPITGTPIGLPGPPHIPLGTPAGLQQHVMRNRTRILMPPPVAKTKITVKHRPGLNYPRPVNHVQINETQREPVRLLPGWLSGLFDGSHRLGHGGGAGAGGAYGDPYCQ
jgi:hypothetical protein